MTPFNEPTDIWSGLLFNNTVMLTCIRSCAIRKVGLQFDWDDEYVMLNIHANRSFPIPHSTRLPYTSTQYEQLTFNDHRMQH